MTAPPPFSTPPATVQKQPTSFKASIPDQDIADFKQLLKLSRLPKETYENLREDRKYGVSRAWLQDAKRAWEEFDWKKSEAYINTFPHFTSTVTTSTPIPSPSSPNSPSSKSTTHTIHFVALFSTNPSAIPLAFFHGWPGSFLEFLPILALLKEQYPDPKDLPYHVIVPSLPGFTFSSPPPLDSDFDVGSVAKVTDQLMQDLGFGVGYVAQGGDIGSRIVKVLGDNHPSCKAVHVNFNSIGSPPSGTESSKLNEAEESMVERGQEFMKTGSGYANMHGTRPATIGAVLASSPLALLAWIGEKFLSWTDDDPSLETILESVSLYWFTQSFESSIYTYRTRFLPLDQQPAQPKVCVPFGFSNFPKEIIPVPRHWAETEGNLVFYREHKKGGHFAALEQPSTLLGDIEEFIEQVWKA
ncbi:related to epoxide hydrolase [Rhynchosporium agropyri]|uniref:Related to epoxide hydrolase n=1 Tax=Rhynchosporium agropyri TaxID=914238 RepID=A0A1E1LMS9_9HELO|nr:related to epoxide hydrolase [Rhynchosporium agropyri]